MTSTGHEISNSLAREILDAHDIDSCRVYSIKRPNGLEFDAVLYIGIDKELLKEVGVKRHLMETGGLKIDPGRFKKLLFTRLRDMRSKKPDLYKGALSKDGKHIPVLGVLQRVRVQTHVWHRIPK
jgi:hypothetical protein